MSERFRDEYIASIIKRYTDVLFTLVTSSFNDITSCPDFVQVGACPTVASTRQLPMGSIPCVLPQKVLAQPSRRTFL